MTTQSISARWITSSCPRSRQLSSSCYLLSAPKSAWAKRSFPQPEPSGCGIPFPPLFMSNRLELLRCWRNHDRDRRVSAEALCSEFRLQFRLIWYVRRRLSQPIPFPVPPRSVEEGFLTYEI